MDAEVGEYRKYDDDVSKDHPDDNYMLPVVEMESLPGKEKELGEGSEVGGEQKKKKVDAFDVTALENTYDGPPWSEMGTKERTLKVLMIIAGAALALGFLYIFICALDILTSSFQLLTGRVAADAFSSSVILNNPIAGLMMGVICTVLLQSSSTTTSIVVAMVGSRILDVQQAIFIIMGANIGTSVTNTIVSLTQSMDKEEFRRSFAGATVHDMFNWLTVIILLPLEAGTHYLYHLTGAIVKHINVEDSGLDEEPQFLDVITNPLTSKIIKVDKGTIQAEAAGTDRAKYPICKYYCDTEYFEHSMSWPLGEENYTYIDTINDDPWTINVNVTNTTDSVYMSWQDLTNQSETCTHLFTGCGGVEGTSCDLSDEAVGGILLACSLTILLTSVFLMVKILSVILKGPMSRAIRVGVNSDLPGKAKFLTGYVAMMIGAGVTMLLQSSSVFTSTLTPLVGMGLISVYRMYPLTLGSNIGTCLTGILAALTSDPDVFRDTMQVALSHLFFNISGICLFFPVPVTRKLPINAARFLGNTTANYRWFAVAYLLVLFFAMPLAIFGLSMAGWQVLVGVLAPFIALAIAIAVVKLMQHYCPLKMHPCCRNWNWLPKPLRSLEPCNSCIVKCCYNDDCVNCRKKCCSSCKDDDDDKSVSDRSSLHEDLAIPVVVVNGRLSEGNVNHCYDGDLADMNTTYL